MPETVPQIREFSLSPLKPETLVGAASPLWGYFAGATIAGVTWWWMTRWMQPGFLRAMGAPASLPFPRTTAAPVGGEAAPISAAAATREKVAEAALEPIEALSQATVSAVAVGTAPLPAREGDPTEVADLAAESAARAVRKAREGEAKPH